MAHPEIVRKQITDLLNLDLVQTCLNYRVQESLSFDGYTRELIHYSAAEGDTIPAFLLLPDGEGPFPAVMVHHQHASQRHLGKSEVVGISGDPLNAFGPELARRGFVVLAPDSICFEDRRKQTSGSEIHREDDLQHFLEMGYRISVGDTLMRKILSDASCGLSILAQLPEVDANRLGVLGHSYGGNTVLFQTALDRRIAFAAASGALCSYKYKRHHNIPLELALIIPGFAKRWDMDHLLECAAPRPLLIVSSEDDQYAKDASEVISRANPNDHISHFRDSGGHELTPVRVNHILNFFESMRLAA